MPAIALVDRDPVVDADEQGDPSGLDRGKEVHALAALSGDERWVTELPVASYVIATSRTTGYAATFFPSGRDTPTLIAFDLATIIVFLVASAGRQAWWMVPLDLAIAAVITADFAVRLWIEADRRRHVISLATAADGAVVISIQSEREWHAFCAEVLRDPAIASDPRFRVNVERVRNRAACDAAVQAILGSRTAAEAAADLDRAGIAYGFISTVGDLMRHPSATALPVETPNGPVEVLAPPVIVNGERPRLKPVPALGEHDAAIRAEFGSPIGQEPA